eukprot:9376870-Prorocentrum_lima.AAC.1
MSILTGCAYDAPKKFFPKAVEAMVAKKVGEMKQMHAGFAGGGIATRAAEVRLRAPFAPLRRGKKFHTNPPRPWDTLKLEEALQCRADGMYPQFGRLLWPKGISELFLDAEAGRQLRARLLGSR